MVGGVRTGTGQRAQVRPPAVLLRAQDPEVCQGPPGPSILPGSPCAYLRLPLSAGAAVCASSGWTNIFIPVNVEEQAYTPAQTLLGVSLWGWGHTGDVSGTVLSDHSW